MARKVLISFLGTGQLVQDSEQKEESKPMREYRAATYKVDGKDYKGYTFMSAALADHYNVDSILMVGTTHSMWEELYRWFHDLKNSVKVEENDTDYNIYSEISECCNKANNESELKIPHPEEIEKVMGGKSKVILIKYGITEEEIRENIKTILQLQDFLSGDDELIVDITHAFRSLPFFVMNLLIYLQNVSSKRIKISHIHYGMLEASREMGYTPVVDLKSVMDVQEWITGAYAFRMFGNAYKISKLLESENKSVSPILKDFSDAMNLNYLYPMRSEVQKLSGLKNKEYKTELPKLIISPVVDDFIRKFGVDKDADRQSLFQLKLADWQFNHKKYAQAYLTSNDAIISYVCEKNDLPWDDYESRELAKNALRNKSSDLETTKEMQKWFKRHNNKRNGIAHTTKVVVRQKELCPRDFIVSLKSDIDELKKIMVLC